MSETRFPNGPAAPATVGGGAVGVPGPPRLVVAAHVVRDDDEAIAIATDLAAGFAASASERDRTHALPAAEPDAYSQSGLWSINVPRAFGGPGLSYVTPGRVIQSISAADPSIAARSCPTWCRSSPSTTRIAPGTRSPTGTLPASR